MKEKKELLKGIKKLWAPWRMKYIEGFDDDSQDDTCIFCSKPAMNLDDECYIVYRGDTCFIILNIYPYNNGHLMVVPYQHTSEMSDLSEAERLEMMNLTEIAMTAIKNVMRPDGFNVGANFGRTAGAGIEDHLHMHIVPRWNGDTNYMPVIGCTKVVSESLEDTYAKVKTAIDDLLEKRGT